MNRTLDLNGRNMVTVMLVQALWGAISPNFRRVAIAFAEPVWQLVFVLEREDVKDREEIDDVTAEFDALLLGLNRGAFQFETHVVVSSDPLSALDPSHWRTVFRRREI